MPGYPTAIGPQDIAVQDARWNTTHWGRYGASATNSTAYSDRWYPHVYETNQAPDSLMINRAGFQGTR